MGNLCLWCGKELESGFFCIGGGPTKTVSRTGEKTFTKSLCLESFLTMLNMSRTCKIPFTEQELAYISWKDDIKEWYKNIPFEKVEDELEKTIYRN